MDFVQGLPDEGLDFHFYNLNKEQVIAWLENKKDTNALIQEASEKAYTEGMRVEREHWLEKQGESTLVEEIKRRKELYSREKEKAVSFTEKLSLGGRIAMLEELLVFTNEKQGEQKPILDFKARNWYVSKVDGKIHDLTYNPTDKKELKKLTQSVTKTSEQAPSILDLKLIDCPLSVKTMNAVKVAINKPAKDVTLGDIIKCNKAELLALRNFGKVSLKELEDFLADYRLKLEGE